LLFLLSGSRLATCASCSCRFKSSPRRDLEEGGTAIARIRDRNDETEGVAAGGGAVSSSERASKRASMAWREMAWEGRGLKEPLSPVQPPMSGGVGRLLEKVAVVTGARGLGRGISLRFAQEGARVAVCDFSLKDAEATARMIEQQGGVAMVRPSWHDALFFLLFHILYSIIF
jgi:hypothetical protein